MSGNPNVLQGDLQITGNFSAGGMTIPSASVSNASVQAAANIASSKLQNLRTTSVQLNGPTTTITTQTAWLTSIKGASGNLVDINAFIAVVGSGGGMSVTIDLQKSTGGGAFATVLSSVITINSATTVRTAVPGTITSTTAV